MNGKHPSLFRLRSFLLGLVTGGLGLAAADGLGDWVGKDAPGSPSIQLVRGTSEQSARPALGQRVRAVLDRRADGVPGQSVGEASEDVELSPAGVAAGLAEGVKTAASARSSAPAQVEGSERRWSAAAVAERAREFTVFIHGGNVYGSGVLMDATGLVLTAWHVIQGLDTINVSFVDEDAGEVAEVLDQDKELDLALLKIRPRARWASTTSSLSMRVGDTAYSMGAPRKLKFSLGRGMVSYVGRPFDDVLFVQTDIPTNSGNSGGPVMNERGEVVALQSFILRDSEGLAFAVPIDYAYQRFAEHLGEPSTFSVAQFDSWVSRTLSEPPSERLAKSAD